MTNQFNDTNEPKILLKDNLLVTTRYSLTPSETKLFTLILYKLQRNGNVLTCKLTHGELREIIRNKNENTVNGLKNLLNEFRKKSIHIKEVKDGKTYWHEYGFINGHTYCENDSTFEIECTEKIYNMVARKFHTGGYTPVNLVAFFRLKNQYGQRMYDLLRLWSNTKTVINYSVEELKHLLMLDGKYPEYTNFKRRVIKPAIDDLNSIINEQGKHFFEIEFKERKIGKKTVSIDFIVKDLDTRTMKGKLLEMFDEYLGESGATSKNKMPPTTAIVEGIKMLPFCENLSTEIIPQIVEDFKGYNFKNGNLCTIFKESVELTVVKDNASVVDGRNYKLFKAILKNKLTSIETCDTIESV